MNTMHAQVRVRWPKVLIRAPKWMFQHKVRLTRANGYMDKERHRGLSSNCGSCSYWRRENTLNRAEGREDELVDIKVYGTRVTFRGIVALVSLFLVVLGFIFQ